MSFQNLRQFENRISIPLPLDENGLIGRECPNQECLGYFKIKPGTGLQGEDIPCHCPYCGYTAGQDEFYTQEQIDYARSVALNTFQKAIQKDMRDWDKKLQRQTRNSFIKLKIEYKGHPSLIHYYREKELETEVICERCSLQYAIYGVFGYCPDCGEHNSYQILDKNLELAHKELTIAENSEDNEFGAYLIADALENAVAAFDGFGREICKVYAAKATDPNNATQLSFQNLSRTNDRLQQLFDFHLSSSLPCDRWEFVFKCFQKRHLLAHKMGVIDEAYVNTTNDPQAIIGRKISISIKEVNELIQHLQTMGEYLTIQLSSI